MKKITNISLGRQVFSVELDAYEVLEQYLTDVQIHFASTVDKDEIISDIESGLAEKIYVMSGGVSQAVTLSDVEKIISDMGKISDFDDGEIDLESTTEGKVIETQRKLYRSSEDVVIAGVASGIAAYCDVDPVWIRLAFALSIFFSGFGVLLYIVLWVIVPKATSQIHTYEMKGKKMDISGIVSKSNEIVSSSRFKQVLQDFFVLVGKIASVAGKIGLFIIGLGLLVMGMVVSGCLLVVVNIAIAGNLIFSSSEPVVTAVFNAVTSGIAGVMLVASSTLLLIVAALVLLMGGVSALIRKNMFSVNKTVALGVAFIVGVSVLFSSILTQASIIESVLSEWGISHEESTNLIEKIEDVSDPITIEIDF